MTDILDIYEAAGRVRNDDGTVTLSRELKPFRIELEVTFAGLRTTGIVRDASGQVVRTYCDVELAITGGDTITLPANLITIAGRAEGASCRT